MVPQRQVWIRFALLCALLVGYVAYLTYQYDFQTGGVAALLTWSFFVLCTPVADAGLLLDFPLRLIFGIRMIVSELAVWALAILLNIVALFYGAAYYETTLMTQIMYQIITNPYPYWGIVLLSAAGTFLSIHFGDELMDVLHHRDRAFFHSHHFKHEMILGLFFVAIIFIYYEMMRSLGLGQI
ncbi:hypothetical protein N8Z65_00675 [bacterium]|nr:hypothetical protein [bacterium]